MTSDSSELVGQTTSSVEADSKHHLDESKLLAYLSSHEAFPIDTIQLRKFSVGQVCAEVDSGSSLTKVESLLIDILSFIRVLNQYVLEVSPQVVSPVQFYGIYSSIRLTFVCLCAHNLKRCCWNV